MSDIIVLIWVAFIFFAAVFFSCKSITHLVQNKKIGIDKGFWLSLSACLVAVMLCLSIGPPFHRVYQDEFAFISQSINIVSSGKPSILLKGSYLQPEILGSWTGNPKLPGFAWLEAVILFLTKDFKHSYFILNLVLGALSVAAVYRITWLLTASQRVAWWSAIFWACLPARITYSMSAVSDIAGVFFFLLFILFLMEFKALKARRILYAALFCGVFSICIKPFYLILVFLGLTVVLHIYRRDGILDKKMYMQAWLDTFCVFLPILCAIPIFLWSDAKAGNYSFSFMLKNFCASVSYLFYYRQNTVLTVLAASVAVGRSIFYKKDTVVMGLAGSFLIGLVMISVFYAGGIAYPGQAYSDRYFLPLAFPLVILAAKGMVDIITGTSGYLLGALIFMVLVVNAFVASKYLTDKAKENFHYQKTLLLKQVFQLVPNEAYILDGCAALVMEISSKKSIQTEVLLSGDRPKQVVFMKGDNDLYDSDDPKNMASAQNILNTAYRCKPLMASPLKEAYLSAVPFLCTRINN